MRHEEILTSQLGQIISKAWDWVCALVQQYTLVHLILPQSPFFVSFSVCLSSGVPPNTTIIIFTFPINPSALPICLHQACMLFCSFYVAFTPVVSLCGCAPIQFHSFLEITMVGVEVPCLFLALGSIGRSMHIIKISHTSMGLSRDMYAEEINIL